MARTHRRTATATCTALLCAATLTALPGAGAAYAEPRGQRDLEDVRAEVASLYRKAEKATDDYNGAREKVTEQQRNVVAIARAIVAAEKRVKELSGKVGSFARAQYRSGGISPEMELFLSADPDEFLARAPLARKGSRAASIALNELESAKGDLDTYGQAASRELRKLTETRKRKADARAEIKERLGDAKALVSSLEAQERARLERLEDEAAYRSQVKWLNSAAAAQLGGDGSGGSSESGQATAAGARAVRFASAQIGKPYEWGAQGPATFDCSGLTSQAWAAAGRAIPRTSQAQWAGLPRVPVNRMRPGDLIIYFADASHVGIYVGGGAMVHAPRPGRNITVAGAGSMPILGVVRPDG